MKKLTKLKFDKKVINELTKVEQSSIKGGALGMEQEAGVSKDFDTPTFNDKCFDGGSTTFKKACTWCGFFHSTKW
ncbi:hypothetical protein [Chryseobacterium kwangjuense]|uniref:Uncharacterized protein n=1 Tax=Chryseobacterium kwangjuense TaxID=267125 RepID=A0A135W8D8_9FLAO|nr:hypothetical protein [Chryseobacterium kwangjuense]KXH81183.1 hypothetical protein AU378_15805 [Chryseobacterium kwangjuense]